jgi:hypothetical protein
MAHFAKIVDNKVVNVIVVKNENAATEPILGANMLV